MTGKAALIAVIDDDVDFLTIAQSVLESGGYRVCCAASVEKGLDLVAQETPDLVVTDLMMARLDSGFALVRALRAQPALADVPVIMVTASESQRGFDFAPRTPEDLKAMQIDAFFSKPVAPKEFLAKVRSLLARRASGGRSGGEERP